MVPASSSDPVPLRVDGLRFRWSAGSAWSLDVPSLLLGPGEQVLVSGPSGGGKSTLLHLAAGLVEPEAGRVMIEGRDLFALPASRRDQFRGRRIGMVFQLFHLLHGFTALENVMMGLVVSDVPRGEHRDRARAILADLGIERTDATPEELSVGQRQRVAVARAVVAGPAVVLADEPTASLDPEAAAAAMDLVQETAARHGAALLCTSHDPAMTTRFERVLHMGADGRVVPAAEAVGDAAEAPAVAGAVPSPAAAGPGPAKGGGDGDG